MKEQRTVNHGKVHKKKGKKDEKDEKVFIGTVGNGNGIGDVGDDVCGYNEK